MEKASFVFYNKWKNKLPIYDIIKSSEKTTRMEDKAISSMFNNIIKYRAYNLLWQWLRSGIEV